MKLFQKLILGFNLPVSWSCFFFLLFNGLNCDPKTVTVLSFVIRYAPIQFADEFICSDVYLILVYLNAFLDNI